MLMDAFPLLLLWIGKKALLAVILILPKAVGGKPQHQISFNSAQKKIISFLQLVCFWGRHNWWLRETRTVDTFDQPVRGYLTEQPRKYHEKGMAWGISEWEFDVIFFPPNCFFFWYLDLQAHNSKQKGSGMYHFTKRYLHSTSVVRLV